MGVKNTLAYFSTFSHYNLKLYSLGFLYMLVYNHWKESFSMLNRIIFQIFTFEGVDGEGLVWLNDEHFKLKVNWTATSHGNWMMNTADREEKKKRRKTDLIYLWLDTNTWMESKVGCIEEYKETGKSLGGGKVTKLPATDLNTHLCPSGTAGRSMRGGMCRSSMTG